MTYSMIEAMSFFGYVDGSVPLIVLSTAETAKDGAFQTEIPLVQEDPFLHDHSRGNRRLRLTVDRIRTHSRAPCTLRPDTISMQMKYDAPLIIHVVKKPKLSGHIGRGFLKENAVLGEVRNGYWPEAETGYRIDLQARTKDGKSSYNCMLKKDYTFSVLLPLGKYDLCLRMMKRGYILHKMVTVKKSVILREADDVRIVIE